MRKLIPIIVLVMAVVPALVFASVPVTMRHALPAPVTQTPATPPEANDGVIPMDVAPAAHGHSGSLDAFDSTIWFDDLEGSQPAWTTEDLTLSPLYWHLDSRRALGGSGLAWACWDSASNHYVDHMLQFLISPTLDLSATTTPTLAFKARWKTEEPVGATAPYNAWDGWNMWISTDDGANWSILQPVSPAYTATSSFAWGDIWDYGANIPVFSWLTGSNCDTVYQPMLFDLTAYRTANVKIRWGFAADDGFSGTDDPTFFGLAVDSIRVMDGTTSLLANDGELDNMTREHNTPVGQFWTYDTVTNHSPTHEWHCLPANSALCAVKTPQISLPTLGANQTLNLRYWVWADQPGFQGSGSTLADYYDIWIEDPDSTVQVVYDYAYNDGAPAPGGNSLNGWVFRTRGLTSGGTAQGSIDLSRWAGRPIHIWYRARYDGQDTTGVGTGIHIDDVAVVFTRAFANDMSMNSLYVNFPTTVGLASKYLYKLRNEGLNGQGTQLRTRHRILKPDNTNQGTDTLIIVVGTLPSGADTMVSRTWSPSVSGLFRIRSCTAMTTDEDRSNDTIWTPANIGVNPDSSFAINVRPAGQYELGYHLRDMTSALLNPRYVHYKPAQDGVPTGTVNAHDITTVRAMWQFDANIPTLPGGAAKVWIEFWEPGSDSAHPGALINRVETFIDTTETIGAAAMPHWWTLNVAGTPGLQNRSGDFWVSVTPMDSVNGTSAPHIMGKTTTPAVYDGHNYTLRIDTVGTPLNPSPSRFCLQTTMIPTTTSTPDPVTTLTAIRDGLTDNIVLNWLPAARATGYFVWRFTNVSGGYQSGVKLTPLPVAGTTYTDTEVRPGLKYFYVVIGIN